MKRKFFAYLSSHIKKSAWNALYINSILGLILLSLTIQPSFVQADSSKPVTSSYATAQKTLTSAVTRGNAILKDNDIKAYSNQADADKALQKYSDPVVDAGKAQQDESGTNGAVTAQNADTQVDAGNKQKISLPKPTSQSDLGPGGYGVSTRSPLDFTKVESSSQVNPLGGDFNYSYPIVFPAGRNGLTPKLNITYSSQKTDYSSIVGQGWSLDIPYIERINKKGTDRVLSQQDFTSTLSGELATTSTAGLFIAKSDDGSFLNYTFATSTWTAVDKNGLTYIFGSTTASQVNNGASTTQITRWMLDTVRDSNGNYISYTYSKDLNQIYPLSIQYVQGTSTPLYSVNFSLASSTAVRVSNKSGFAITTEKRISAISVVANATTTRMYTFSYTQSQKGNIDFLSSIQDHGFINGIEINTPPTTFTYNETTNGGSWNDSASWANTLPNELSTSFFDINGYYTDYYKRTNLVDINGDGLPDWLSYGTAYLNTGSGWDASSTWTLPVNSFDGPNRLDDINGDGLPDIIVDSHTIWAPNFSHADDYTKLVYLNNGDGTWTQSTSTAATIPSDLETIIVSPSGIPTAYEKQVFIVDMNGDGLDDWVDNGNAYLNTGSGWTGATWTGMPATNFAGAERLADVNGDGLPDVIHSRETDWTANWNQPVTYDNSVYLNNGDGTWTNSTQWNTQFPTYLERLFFDVNGTPHTTDFYAYFEDIDGDGLKDWIGNGRAYLNTGTGWSATSTWSTMPTTVFDSNSRLADIDGDGQQDIVQYSRVVYDPRWNHPDDVVKAAHINMGQTQWLMTNITNSNGGKTDITYSHSAMLASGQKLNPQLPFNFSVVKQVKDTDPVNNISHTVNYSFAQGSNYYNPSDLYDRQFAGFGKVTVSDSLKNTTTYYHQANSTASTTGEYLDTKSKIGKPYRIETSDTYGHLYALALQKWDQVSRGGQAYFPELVQKTDELFNGNTDHADKASTFSYDPATGNLTQEADWGSVSAANDGSFIDTGNDKLIRNVLYASTTANHISKPSDDVLTNQSGTKLSETRHYYDLQSLGLITKGNETKQENWIASSTFASTTHAYNSYGLVTQDVDPRGNATNYTYDPYTLYVATSTNPLLQVKKYAYNYANGAVQDLVNENGQLYHFHYDGLGRLLDESEPDPTIASTSDIQHTISYDYSSYPVITDYLHLNSSSPALLTYIYLDGLGREIQRRTQAEAAGIYMVTDKTYDTNGLLSTESIPYFSSGSSRTTATTTSTLLKKYTYDPLGNVKNVATADGSTSTTYSGWGANTTDPLGHTKGYTLDAYGNLSQVREMNAGTTYITNYGWDGLKNLTSITDANGNVRNFTYDGISNRITAQDLHASSDPTFGTWTYTYDPAGNSTSRKDPNNQTTNSTYDALNRLKTEDFTGTAGIEKTYTYDSCPNGILHICTASSTAAITKYSYNPLGLVSVATTTIVGTSTPFTTSYKYDWLGNQTSITYPDNSIVNYTYNNAGLLETVQQKESSAPAYSTVIANIDYSPVQKPTLIAYGNGTVTNNSYNPASLYRLSSVQTYGTASSTIQNLSYTYDADGNVQQFLDLASTTAPVSVSYTYDDLNRLLLSNYTTGTTTRSSWYNGNWAYRVPIVASSTKVLEDTKDVYFDLSKMPSNFAANVQPNGCDIRVTKSDGVTELPIDVASFATSTGQLYFSTGNSLSTSSPTTYYIYYGNPSASCYTPNANYGARNVYDANSAGVWHLEENTSALGGIKDSTVNANNGTMYSNYAPNANGSSPSILGQASNFDGVGQTIDIPNSNNYQGTNMTIEGWVYLTSTPSSRNEKATLVTKKNTVSPYNSYSIYVSNPTNSLDSDWVGSTGTSSYAGSYAGSLATSTWYYFALRHDSSTTTAELSVRNNGSSTNTYTADTDGTTFNSDDVLRLGASYAGGERLQGKLDEVRVHTNALSDAYLATRYSNFSSPATFWQVGTSTPYAVGSTSVYTEQFMYDPIGNITNKSTVGAYGYSSGTGLMNPNAVTSIGSSTYAYDNNGNLTSGGGLSNQWNYLNQLTQSANASGTSTYAYDIAGNRIKQTVNGVTTYMPSTLYSVVSGGVGTSTKKIYAGSTLAATITLPYTPPAASTSTNRVYDEALNSGWNDWSFNSTRNFANTNPVNSGSKSIAVTYTAVYGGLYLNTTGTSTAPYTHLHIAFNSASSSPALQVLMYNAQGNPIAAAVPLSAYVSGGTILANTWYSIDVPLSDLGASATTTTGFVIQKDSPGTIYVDDLRFVSLANASPIRYVYPDLLGSTNLVADASGAPIESLVYTPYGAIKTDTQPGGSQKKYIGQIYDASSNLNYLNARYQDPVRGQFLSEDPVFLDNPSQQTLTNPQGLNSYNYANDNPITGKDPNGRFAIGLGVNFGGGSPGLYGANTTYWVLTVDPSTGNIEAGTTNSWEGGGMTDVESAGVAAAGMFSPNANSMSDLSGVSPVFGGSWKEGIQVGGGGSISKVANSNRKIFTFNGAVGVAESITPYVVPVEVHGGVSNTKIVNSVNLTQSIAGVTNSARNAAQSTYSYFQSQINSIQNQINQLRAQLNQSNTSKSSNSR